MVQHADHITEPVIGRWRPALIAWFSKRVQHRHEAEDLAQEVLIRLISRAQDRSGRTGSGQYTAGLDNPDAFVFTIAANLLKDYVRRKQVRDQYCLSSSESQIGPHEQPDPFRHAASREDLQRVLAVLRDLPERTRRIFILYRIEHVRQADIAEAFQISTSAVKKHVARAMAQIVALRQEGRG